MGKRLHAIISAAIVLGCAAPALAENISCSVTAPEIRVRQTPSKKGRVVAILKKNARVTAGDKCGGGWVKVTSEDGKISGYVGGWALADGFIRISPSAQTTQSASSTTEATANGEKQGADSAKEPEVQRKEAPSNEQLAVQITEMRVRMLGLERNVKSMNRDIQRIKAAMGRKVKSAKK